PPPLSPLSLHAALPISPSRVEEPFGHSAIEAVLALRPVVASDSKAGQKPEGGYRTARLVPPGDARATADALEEIIRSWSSIVRLDRKSTRLNSSHVSIS